MSEGAPESFEEFLDRHAFALFPDGGMALDLRTGSYSSLNASAAEILGVICGTRVWEEALEKTSARWGLSRPEAGAAIEQLRIALARAERAPMVELDYPYVPLGAGYALPPPRSDPSLPSEADVASRQLSLVPPPPSFPSRSSTVFVSSPKILNALERIVLHAAANDRGGLIHRPVRSERRR